MSEEEIINNDGNRSSDHNNNSSNSNNDTTTTRTKSLFHNALGSATAAIVSRTFTHPLDTAKARLQVDGSTFQGPLDVLRQAMRQPHTHPRPSSPLQCQLPPRHLPLPQLPSAFLSSYSHLGIRSLYRGFGTVILGGTPGTMLYFCSYEYIKETMSRRSRSGSGPTSLEGAPSSSSSSFFMIHFLGGLLAEAIACIIYVPVDVLKERMQVSNTYRNSWHGLTQIWHHEGIRGIYRGYGATLASFGPFSAFYFLFYEQFKTIAVTEGGTFTTATTSETTSARIQHSEELPFFSILLCSCSAGALASWLTSPLDMAKLRLQVQRGASTNQTVVVPNATAKATTIATTAATTATNSSMFQILYHVAKTEGMVGLFRGAGARVLHFAPATTITMTCYETCRSFYAQVL